MTDVEIIAAGELARSAKDEKQVQVMMYSKGALGLMGELATAVIALVDERTALQAKVEELRIERDEAFGRIQDLQTDYLAAVRDGGEGGGQEAAARDTAGSEAEKVLSTTDPPAAPLPCMGCSDKSHLHGMF